MKLLDSLYSVISEDSCETGHEYVIKLDPEHFIYKAHFPGEPITPGVCIMQIAVELFEKALGASLALECVKNIKFLQIISPKDVTEVKYAFNKIVREDSEIKVQVTVSDADHTYAKLSLVCREL